eukprot:Seg898.6 transcript_id=Seg898.6/GoldUCD/mRNA.D3Y31 product="Transmembrane protein 87A" protein_id=Seg898.6/GoldUCD/D3Y31
MASRCNMKWKMKSLMLSFFMAIIILDEANSLPEPGKKRIVLTEKKNFGMFKKIAFKGSTVKMTGVTCSTSSKGPLEIAISWKLKYSHCAETFMDTKPTEFSYTILAEGEIIGLPGKIKCHEFRKSQITAISKWGGVIVRKLPKETKRYESKLIHGINSTTEHTVLQNATAAAATTKGEGKSKRRQRSLEKKAGQKDDSKSAPVIAIRKTNTSSKNPAELKTEWSGAYFLIINAATVDGKGDFKLKIDVEIQGKRGYLSATEWPLLPFFGVMSLVYLAYAIGWFSASCCNWRELLRIQFWIGGVIALGMLEKALFYTEYKNVNHTGEESNGLVIFAELVSCLKRALARILVIIVSMGFGIVKPRLGSALPKILACGLLFFILASIEGCFRALSPKASPSRQQMIAAIPLVVLDSVLCWWVFTALVQTTRTLRIRKNVVKLSLYRHFTNTLIFAVIASIIYMAWSIKSHTYADCTDWSEVWLDDAFWPFLFSLILLVIMILWRPTINNQRYAFTPLVDFSDDEDEPHISDAYDGMKLRSMRKESNGNLKNRSTDDDLRWVEENIPSIPSTILPSLDSDEEIMTTKLEMSKMQ